MMNGVTYADLRFTNTIPMEAKERGSTLEDHDEDNDIMYENVTSVQPARENNPPPAPAMGRGHQLTAGLRKCSLHLSLVFLLLCLILSAGVIGIAVKYVQMSSEFQKLVTEHQTMSSSMAQSLRSGENFLESVRNQLRDTKTELDKTRLELRKVVQENQHLNSSLRSKEDLMELVKKDLMETKNGLEKTRLDLEKAVQNNTELNNDLSQCRKEEQKSKDVCPEEWILYKDKCLWFSKEKKIWESSRADCEWKYSNLVIVQKNDKDLQKFIGEQGDHFWVGKEWNVRTEKWKWPTGYSSSYSSSYSSDGPWEISFGSLDTYNSYYRINRWICEKNIILTKANDPCWRNV